MASRYVPRRSLAHRMLGVIALLSLPAPAEAIDKSWTNASGGVFSSSANWNSILPPDSTDTAHFGVTTPPTPPFPPTQWVYTVSFTADRNNQALVIEDDVVTFDLNGHIYTTTAALPITLGTVSGFSGRLTVTDGTVVAPLASNIRLGANSTGSLTVTTGGLLGGSPNILVGYASPTSTLTINNSGDVVANDVTVGYNAAGTATITGSGSSLISAALIVARGVTGTLNITAGAHVDSASGRLAEFSGGTGIVNVDGGGSLWDLSGDVSVGENGTGTLNVTAGSHVQDRHGFIGFNSGSVGTANVSGALSKWINSGVVQVGFHGQGALNVTAGGTVSAGSGIIGINDSASGSATVSGVGSTWTNAGSLYVGLEGVGQMTIESGGSVSSNGGFVGGLSGASGTAKITGADSRWSNSGDFSIGGGGAGELEITAGGELLNQSNDLVVGDSGVGLLKITAGGKFLEANKALLGNETGSTGEIIVSGQDSLLDVVDRLTIGESGQGILTITDRGSVANDVGIIGGAGSRVTVRGVGSTWTNRSVLNFLAGGQLIIEGGGSVSSLGSNIGVSGTSANIVAVTGLGSTWNVAGLLTIGLGNASLLSIQPGATVSVTENTQLFSGSELTLQGGTLATSEVSFNGGGNFHWTSGTLHVGTFHGDLANPNGGVLAPGNSAGRTLIQGDYTQAAGATLDIEIGGVLQSLEYDAVIVQGDVVLNGNLKLTLLGSFVPPTAGKFTILSAGAVTGAFANVANGQRLFTADGLGSFVVNYGAASPLGSTFVALSAFQAALPGDYNADGHVDAADFTLWRDHLGQTFTLPNENPAATTHGLVDEEDYTFWKLHFGESSGSASLATAIPEPATIGLFLAGIAALSTKKTPKFRSLRQQPLYR